MNKKYKELPLFETNEFKVGDEVKVYDSSMDKNKIYVVQFVGPSLVQLQGYGFFNFQVCRKLEEIKAREFWIPKDSLDELFNRKFTDWYGREKLCDQYMTPIDRTKYNKDYIKVREVLDD